MDHHTMSFIGVLLQDMFTQMFWQQFLERKTALSDGAQEPKKTETAIFKRNGDKQSKEQKRLLFQLAALNFAQVGYPGI